MRVLLASLLLALPAATSASTYRVELVTPVKAREIVRDVAWSCVGSACVAPRAATSPDANVCAAVVRRLGPVTAFSAAGRSFDADALAKCNAAAR